MTEAPVEREGCTEMTFDLLRYEITNTLRWLQFKPAGLTCPGRNMDNATIEEKERMIEKLTMYLEEKYLRHCDMTIPLQWVAANVARLVSSPYSGKIYLLTSFEDPSEDVARSASPHEKSGPRRRYESGHKRPALQNFGRCHPILSHDGIAEKYNEVGLAFPNLRSMACRSLGSI